jgi:hypothetical protein
VCVCVCVRACVFTPHILTHINERTFINSAKDTKNSFLYVCMYVCIYIYTHTHTHTYIYTYMYIYIGMLCVCECVSSHHIHILTHFRFLRSHRPLILLLSLCLCRRCRLPFKRLEIKTYVTSKTYNNTTSMFFKLRKLKSFDLRLVPGPYFGGMLSLPLF